MNHALTPYVLSGIGEYVSWWQWILLLVLIGLIVAWWMIRQKQQ